MEQVPFSMWLYHCYPSGVVVRWLTHTLDYEGSTPTGCSYFLTSFYIYIFLHFYLRYYYSLVLLFLFIIGD